MNKRNPTSTSAVAQNSAGGGFSGVNALAGAANYALLTPEQVAKLLGFTEGWLAKLRMRGGGPKWIRLGRKCRYTLADLDAWIHAHRVSNTSELSKAQREGWA